MTVSPRDVFSILILMVEVIVYIRVAIEYRSDCTIIISTIHLIVSGILAFINCWDVKWATRVQDIFTYAKLLALFVIIFTGAYQLCTGKFVVINMHIKKFKFSTQ